MADQTAVLTHHRTDLQEPNMYQVLIHNDDYTPMDFVVDLLQRIFRKDEAAAHKIMMAIHQQGIGVGGTYVRDIAETKVAQAHSMAKGQEYPLRCSLKAVTGGQD
ncbi:MAG: ATP-dependent Clp protease adaptor ClpS [Oligoflexales bacterium]